MAIIESFQFCLKSLEGNMMSRFVATCIMDACHGKLQFVCYVLCFC